MRTLFSFIFCISILSAHAQSPTGQGGSITLDYLGLEPCGAAGTNQFFVLTVGTGGYQFGNSSFELKSECATQSISNVITALGSNPSVVQQMNNLIGNCLSVFTDIAAIPSGYAHAGMKVLVFVSPNPDLSSFPPDIYADLCGSSVLVAFGNYSGVDAFFPNAVTYNRSCGNSVSVQMTSQGGVGQLLTYFPLKLHAGMGSFVQRNQNNGLTYGNSKNCSAQILYCGNLHQISFAGDTEICEGEMTTIQCNVSPAGAYDYQWSSGQTTQTVNLKPAATNKYTVSVTLQNRPNCLASEDVIIRVFNSPQLVVSARNVRGTLPCTNEDFFLSWDNNPNDDQAVAGFHWLDPSGAVIPSNIQLNMNVQTAGTYTLVVEYANGCIAEKKLDVQPPATVPVRICTNAPVCFEDVELEASSTDAVLYEWYGPGNEEDYYAVGASQVIDYWYDFYPGLYTVVATDANGCTSTGSVWAVNMPNCQGGRPISIKPDNQAKVDTVTTVIATKNTLIQERSLIDLKSFSLFPNPASQILNIKVEIDFEIAEFQIFDVVGRLKMSQKTPPTEFFTIQLESFSPGVYFFKAKSASGEVRSKKFIVKEGDFD